MEKTATLNLRVNPTTKKSAEVHTKLQEGFYDLEAGRVQDAKEADAAIIFFPEEQNDNNQYF